MTSTELIPSARRLMESLRDIGYDLPAAVADLVDNSIDADAEDVRIDVGHDLQGGWIRIADDGIGMTERRLEEAKRFGSSRNYAPTDLGHFGLGLKTASLSQCRRLTVATRSTIRGPMRIRRWDLDHVARTDSWQLERLTLRDSPSVLTDPLVGSTGTVVLWEHLDRGGSNGNRTRLWKTELQKLANQTGLEIVVCHFPPGTSKWNKLEHRLFSFISKNWRGQPLVSYEVIINLIAATSTSTGLEVHARLDENDDPTVEVTDAELTAVKITRHSFHPEWNYSINPSPN